MALLDLFERYLNHPVALLSTAKRHGTVVPDDSDPVTVSVGAVPSNKQIRPRALYFKAAGNVVIVDDEGTSITYAVSIGQVLDVSPYQVKATGTTVAAGNIIGWW